MTIEEYSTLMGYQVTCSQQEYVEANLAYMMAGNMDKQTFCKEYKKIGNNPLLRELAHAANSRDIAFRDKMTKERQTAHALLRQSDNLRMEAVEVTTMEDAADAIDNIAAKLIGRKDCINWKLKKGFRLNETDNEYIKDNLI